VFNPLTPAEMADAMGRTARDAARSSDPADGFVRAQLMSVYSASRHLGVELTAFEPELQAFVTAVARATAQAGADAGGGRLGDELGETSDPRALGGLVCELLDEVRGDRSAAARDVHAAVRSKLAGLVDREVELLADVIERAAER
jgi:hypothetical protein